MQKLRIYYFWGLILAITAGFITPKLIHTAQISEASSTDASPTKYYTPTAQTPEAGPATAAPTRPASPALPAFTARRTSTPLTPVATRIIPSHSDSDGEKSDVSALAPSIDARSSIDHVSPLPCPSRPKTPLDVAEELEEADIRALSTQIFQAVSETESGSAEAKFNLLLDSTILHKYPDLLSSEINKFDPTTHSTPLHIAIERGHVSVIKLLLQHGADIQAQKRITAPAPTVDARATADHSQLVDIYNLALQVKRPDIAFLLKYWDRDLIRVLEESMIQRNFKNFNQLFRQAKTRLASAPNDLLIKIKQASFLCTAAAHGDPKILLNIMQYQLGEPSCIRPDSYQKARHILTAALECTTKMSALATMHTILDYAKAADPSGTLTQELIYTTNPTTSANLLKLAITNLAAEPLNILLHAADKSNIKATDIANLSQLAKNIYDRDQQNLSEKLTYERDELVAQRAALIRVYDQEPTVLALAQEKLQKQTKPNLTKLAADLCHKERAYEEVCRTLKNLQTELDRQCQYRLSISEQQLLTTARATIVLSQGTGGVITTLPEPAERSTRDNQIAYLAQSQNKTVYEELLAAQNTPVETSRLHTTTQNRRGSQGGWIEAKDNCPITERPQSVISKPKLALADTVIPPKPAKTYHDFTYKIGGIGTIKRQDGQVTVKNRDPNVGQYASRFPAKPVVAC